MVGEILAEKMRREDAYEKAMNQFLSFKPEKLRKSAKDQLPSRVEIYWDGRPLRG
jgi:hypothetical protein